jgi:tRNA (guanine-N7-)-methyltransferase
MRLDSFIVDWRAVGYPIELDKIFGRRARTELEIGIGNGLFLARIARDNPDKNFVGIEIVKFFARKAERKVINAGLSNVRIFIGDAKLLLLILFRDRTFGHIYLNFPDPWFKKRHKKRRIMRIRFNLLMAKRLEDGGLVSVATDHPEFRDFVIESMLDSGAFESVFPGGYTTEPFGDYTSDGEHYVTKYEEKWRSQGKDIFYMRFRKTNHPLFDINEYLTDERLWYSVYINGVKLDRVPD